MLKINKLERKSKLNTPKSFQRVYNDAKKFRCKGISVLVCHNYLTYSRFGICIAKKQIPRAVDRNRIKRIIREYFRLKKHDLNPCLDLVFFIYSTVLELSNNEINSCLEGLWVKLIKYYKEV